MAIKSAAAVQTPPTATREEADNLLEEMDKIMQQLEKKPAFNKLHKTWAEILEEYGSGTPRRATAAKKK